MDLSSSLDQVELISMNFYKEKLVITGCGRNVSSFIPAVKNTIRRYASLFSECSCVFIVSDSNDDTVQQLEELNKTISTIVIDLGDLRDKKPIRESRLALCRNYYLDYIQNNLSNYDYMLILDLDEVCIGPVSKKSIKSNFMYQGWDMICANVRGHYYDLHALRGCDSIDRFTTIQPSDQPIRVTSAFGGAAFVKINSIGTARHNINCGSVCEWVSFCNSLKSRNIFINPGFIIQHLENSHVVKRKEYCR